MESGLPLESAERQTLPIGYYPDLSDDDIDKILVDERPSTVEWMVTPAEWAKHLNVPDIREAFKDVSASAPTMFCLAHGR